MDRAAITKALNRPRTLIALATLLIAATGVAYRTAAILPGCMIVICVVLCLYERPQWDVFRARWFKPIVAVAWLVLAVSFLLPAVRVMSSSMSGAECFWIALRYQWFLIGDREFINAMTQSVWAGNLNFVGNLFDVYYMRMLIIANVGAFVLPIVRRWLPKDATGYLTDVWLGCAAATWAFPMLWRTDTLLMGYYVWAAVMLAFATLWPMNVYKVYLVMAVIAAVAVRSAFGPL